MDVGVVIMSLGIAVTVVVSTVRKVKVEKKKDLCPICGEELIKLQYLGVRRIVKDRDSPDYVGSFIDDLVGSDGALNWCEAPSGSYG